MKKQNLLFGILMFLLFGAGIQLQAQNVSINNDGSKPDSSAMLDVKSTEKGVLVPRMTEAQKNAIINPATGLVIFQIDGGSGFYYYANSGWQYISSSTALMNRIIDEENTRRIADSTIQAELDALGTMADQDTNDVVITGGTIDGTVIGASQASSGVFTGLKMPTGAAGGYLLKSDAEGNGSWTQSPILSRNEDTIFISGGNYIVLPGVTQAMQSTNGVQERLDNGDPLAQIIADNGIDALIGKKYGGGVIFYLNDNGDGLVVDTTNYDDETYPWGHMGKNFATNNSTLGWGYANNQEVKQNGPESGSAFYFCTNLSTNGFDDWFLGNPPENSELWNFSSEYPGIRTLLQDKRILTGSDENLFVMIYQRNSTQYTASSYEGSGPRLKSDQNMYVRPIRMICYDVTALGGSINGINALAFGETVTLSVDPVSWVKYYNWTFPSCITINNGQGWYEVNVTVNAPLEGTISVTAMNDCGESEPISVNFPDLEQLLQSGDIAQIIDSLGGNTNQLLGQHYQGGLIFYVDEGYVLITAPEDQSNGAGWGCQGDYIGTTFENPGTGSFNTTQIIQHCATSGIAAAICEALTLEGYDDWYLPSLDEMEKLIEFHQATDSGNFVADTYYHTSTETDSDNNHVYNTNASSQSQTKSTLNHVRAIRSIALDAPPTPLEITGDFYPPVEDTVSYTCVFEGLVDAFEWQVPAGCTTLSGDETATIRLIISGMAPGELKVRTHNPEGWSPYQSYTIFPDDIQYRLDNGETPFEIYQSDNALLYKLYGKRYQDGIIFYLNTLTGNGKTAALDALNSDYWDKGYSALIGASSNTDGKANSITIVQNYNTSSNPTCAAQQCVDYVSSANYTNWYLPARDELETLFTNIPPGILAEYGIEKTFDFNKRNYLSSTEWTYYWAAWIYNYYDEVLENKSKNEKFRYIPIREFSDLASTLTVQQRLDNGETPYEIYQSDNILLIDLYGCTYQDGIIFELDTSTGEGKVYYNQPLGNTTWGCSGTSVTTSTTDGQANTNAILAACSTSDIAADLCDDFVSTNNYSNWFLPTRNEFELITGNTWNVFASYSLDQGNGTYGNPYYYTSEQYSSTDAYFFHAQDKAFYNASKLAPFRVLPVHKFTAD
ncbi:MAG: DUF1566 domain-containing protein [Bacteroidales bacterium]|nr:DUF1566 domain-containing protein [Bacteroidales bacterium]